MRTSHQLTSTNGSETCKTMEGGEGEVGVATAAPTFFSALRVGVEFLDVVYGSYWVKTGEREAACDSFDDGAFSYLEVAGFGANEPVLEGG